MKIFRRRSDVIRARIHLHGAQALALLGLVGIALNGVIADPWWLVMLWAVVNGFALGAGLSLWRRPYRFALTLRIRRIHAELETGAWCDACALPSALIFTGAELSKRGVTRLPTAKICTRCNLTTTGSH